MRQCESRVEGFVLDCIVLCWTASYAAHGAGSSSACRGNSKRCGGGNGGCFGRIV